MIWRNFIYEEDFWSLAANWDNFDEVNRWISNRTENKWPYTLLLLIGDEILIWILDTEHLQKRFDTEVAEFFDFSILNFEFIDIQRDGLD